jgi:hypothetical protein
VSLITSKEHPKSAATRAFIDLVLATVPTASSTAPEFAADRLP